jgi:DNA-binding transcriptional regulator YiaG
MRRVSTDEILELMRLKGWSRCQLAAQLDLTENTVHGWFAKRRTPGGPASILMRLWLTEARTNRREPAAAS